MAREPRVRTDAFELAGLDPHESDFSRWSVSISSESRARSDERTLEPKTKVCAACGSEDTRCVYADGVFGKEQWKSFELLCTECGVYTWWRWDAW